MLGNREAALQEDRRAMELLPIEKDPVSGYELRACSRGGSNKFSN